MAQKRKSSGKKAARGRGGASARRAAAKAVRRIPVGVRIAVILILLAAAAAFLLYYNYYIDPLANWFRNDRVATISGRAEGDLRVHFVDVDQGDGIVVELPDGKVMVIDGGPRSAKSKMLNYLDALNVKTIDYVVLTHADEDHVGSLDDVVNHCEVKSIYMPGMTTKQITTTVYRQFNDAVTKRVKSGAVKLVTDNDSDIAFDDGNTSYLLDFFADSDLYGEVQSGSDAHKKNAVSPFIFLSYAGKKVLFTGDANFESETWLLAEEEIAARPQDYDVDVLKVGHHGSHTSTGEEFLDVVRPEYAVISCGLDNKYDHPRPEALQRLAEAGVPEKRLYRTDLQGDVVLTLDPTDEGVISFCVGKSVSADGVAYTRITVRFEAQELLSGAYITRRRTA